MVNHGELKDSGEYFVIAPESRKVVIPHKRKAIGTVGDHNSEQITFECPQYIDGHDISQCSLKYITWVNVHGEVGNDELHISKVENGMCYLTWTIRNLLTVAKGVVRFSVHFEDKADETTLYRWSTATCRDCEILDSINAVIGAYEAIYVSGETLVFADLTPVNGDTFALETNGLIPEGTVRIEENGVYDVGEVAQVQVAVSDYTQAVNGTITVDYDLGVVLDIFYRGENPNAPIGIEDNLCFRVDADTLYRLSTKFVKGSPIIIKPYIEGDINVPIANVCFIEFGSNSGFIAQAEDASLFVVKPTGEFTITVTRML